MIGKSYITHYGLNCNKIHAILLKYQNQYDNELPTIKDKELIEYVTKL